MYTNFVLLMISFPISAPREAFFQQSDTYLGTCETPQHILTYKSKI